MPLNCIVYEGEDLETYRDYNALPNDNKDGRIWDSEERNICRIKNQLKTIILLLRITHVLIVNKGLRLTIMELGMPNI